MNGVKETFTKLTESYIGFTLFRAVIIITVVLTLFNSLNSPIFKETLNNYNKVIKLSDTSWGVPMTNNWIVNRMYPDHGIYDKDSLSALYTAHSIQSRYMPQEQLQKLFLPNVIDTAKINEIRHQQDSLQVKIEQGLATVFSLNLSFISNTKVDLQYWIYLLPLVYFLSAIYIGIISTKIRLVVEQSDQLALNPQTEGLSLKAFDKYPFLYLKQLLIWIEISFLILFLYTYYSLLLKIPGFFSEIVFLIQIGAFYSVVSYLRLTDKIIKDNNSKGHIREIFITIYKYLRHLASGFIKTGRIKRYTISGNFLIIATLFVVMSTRGCKRDSPMMESTFFYHYNGHWIKTDSLPLDITASDYSGYELIINFGSKIWDFGRENIFLNRLLQVFYTLTIMASLLVSCTLLVRFIWKKSIDRSQWLLHYLTIFISIAFLIYVVYYTTEIFSLPVRCIFIFILLYGWININRSELKYSGFINYNQLLKSVLVISLPFLILIIIRASIPVWVVVSTTIERPGGLLYTLFIVMFLKGYLILPIGLLLLLSGLQKIQRKRINIENSG